MARVLRWRSSALLLALLLLGAAAAVARAAEPAPTEDHGDSDAAEGDAEAALEGQARQFCNNLDVSYTQRKDNPCERAR
jgi:Spy/CpxP family protein refolding chaperone